jgi:thymidylate kinase
MNENNIKNPISIVIEGLDGIGKSTTVIALSNKLNAKIIQTPPKIMIPYRSFFTNTNDIGLRKTYYKLGNYISGNHIEEAINNGYNVVVDRYYASTIAYILGQSTKDLSEISDELYRWPEGMYKPDYMILLVMDEKDRIERLNNRDTQQTNEEIFLKQNPVLITRINDIYSKLGCIKVKILKDDDTNTIVDKILNEIYKK